MEFAVSGSSIKQQQQQQQNSSSNLKLPQINNRGSYPETSPRVSLHSGRRQSGNGIRRTSSSESSTQEKPRSREESNQSNNSNNSNTNGTTSTTSTTTTNPIPRHPGKNPIKMQRAKNWSPEVENLFRYQAAGFRDQDEYMTVYPPPECWESTGFIKTLQAKQTGYYMYFRQDRECEDRYLNKIKIYSY